MTTHYREDEKETAYVTTGSSRESDLAAAKERLVKIEEGLCQATKGVEEAQAEHQGLPR